MKIYGIALVIILTLCFIITPTLAGWRTETVDSAENVGKYTSLALDSAGYPHISYYDDGHGDLMYARWTGSAWTIEAVDTAGDTGQYTSIAVNTDGYPFPQISYYDNSTHSLNYAKRVIGDPPWDIDIVDAISGGDVGKYNSLALDESGYPHISYYDATNGKLKYVWWDGSGWSWPDIVGPLAGGDWGQYSSLALDGSGHPHISFYDSNNHFLKYAKKTGPSWTIQTVDDDGDVGKYTSLALDGFGHPHISYYDATEERPRYAKWTGTEWEIQEFGYAWPDIGSYSSLALDGSGSPRISCFYTGPVTPDRLFYLYLTKSGWHANEINYGEGVGEYTSLALDDSGIPHISYFDGGNGHLMFAEYVPSCIGVFRQSVHSFFLDYNRNGRWDGALTDRTYDFGLTGDLPVSADWDRDLISEIGVYRPSTHTFYLDFNGNGRWDGAVTDRAYNFGLTGDLPISGEWANSGSSHIGVYRPSTHTFYLDWNGNGVWNGAGTDRAYDFGLTGDLPVAGDWNDDGRTNIGVFRPSTQTFYLDYNRNGKWDGAVTDRAYTFGLTGDQPLSGDWNGDMQDKIGVFRPSTHTFYLDFNGNGRWDGAVTDRVYNFGLAEDSPLSGMWG